MYSNPGTAKEAQIPSALPSSTPPGVTISLSPYGVELSLYTSTHISTEAMAEQLQQFARNIHKLV
jgi:hypothetical protein